MSPSRVVLIACVAAVGLAAQQAQPPQPPTFRAEANLVRVDVTVVDRRGEPMTTLTADDFAVEEDGTPQTIQSFKFVSADGQPPPGDDSLPIRSPEHAASEAARDEVRVFVIFWDEYHIGRFAEAIKGRRALTTFVSTAFGPSDLVALMDPLLPVDALKFTRDRRELAQTIAKLEGRFGIYMPTRSAAEDNMLERGRDVARLRSEVTISALQSAAVHLGSIKEGRKAIIFVSEGLTGLGMDQLSLISDLTQTANNNNAAIYTVDPAGLTGGSADVLRTIAENTGAEAFVNTNTPEKALRQVVREASAFYLLGYASTRNPQDGKFHKIGVKVKRSGINVRARRGYWAPAATELEKARAEAAAASAIPADVTNAMTVLSTARAERLVDVWVGAARGADDVAIVTVAWTPRSAAGVGRGTAPTRNLTVAIKGAGGDRSFDPRLDAGALSFPSPPGLVQLQITARDADGNILDEDRRPFTVPDLTTSALTLGTPVLVRARTVAEARALAGGEPARPFAGHEFNRIDHLFVRFGIYGAAAADADVRAHLTNKAGTILLSLPLEAMTGPGMAYQIEFPLASIARGDYLIAVAAAHGEERARALVPIRILSF